MNKLYSNVIKELGFNVENDISYGDINNYQCCMEVSAFSAQSFIGVIIANFKEQVSIVNKYLADKQKDLKIVKYEVAEKQIFFSVRGVTIKGGISNLRKALETITAYLATIGVPDSKFCPICGNEMAEKVLIKADYPFYADENCASQINADIERQEIEFQNSPNNYLKGTLGAIVGGLIGGIIWIIIGLMGFISGWIALLIAILAGYFYDKFKGKPNKMKLVITSIVTLVIVVISLFAVYLILANSLIVENGLANTPFALLIDLLQNNSEVLNGFIYDLVISIIFSGIGIGLSIVIMRKKLHKSKK